MTRACVQKETKNTVLELHHAVIQTLVGKTEFADQHPDETPGASR